MVMKFYLDNDVDVGCARSIRNAGHTCWSASEAGNQNSSDDEQTVYAMNRGAILITHDREFTVRRKRMPMGQHIRMVCHQMDAPELLERAMPKISDLLQASPNIVLEVSKGSGDLLNVQATFGTETYMARSEIHVDQNSAG